MLEAVGRITQAQTYGENLIVTRTYRSELGVSSFTMEDVVENAGFLPTEHMLLYHINAGYVEPLNGAGAVGGWKMGTRKASAALCSASFLEGPVAVMVG